MYAHRHSKSSSDNRLKYNNNHVKNMKQNIYSNTKKNNNSFIIREKKKKEKSNLIKILHKNAYKRLYKKYNCLNKDYEYILVEHFLNNANTHLVSVFKDHMIMDYKEEFLIKYYLLKDSIKRLPEFQIYYQNYLLFFCKPMISQLNLNEILLDQEEKKAEIYYKHNYAKNNNSEIDFFNENSYVSKIKITDNTLFSESIKESIDKAKLTTENSNIKSNSNSTLLLTYDTIKNEIEKMNISKSKNISNSSTICDIINGFYNKRIEKVITKNSKKNSVKNILKKISKEKIKYFIEKGCFSYSNINNILKNKHKKISSPTINNYKYKPKIKSVSKEKNVNTLKANSHSKVKTTLSTSKSLIKSPTSKSRNNRNGLSNLSKGNSNTNFSNKTNTIYKSTISFNNSNSKQNIHLFKTQNIEKFLHKYHFSNSNNGNLSKKKYISEFNNNNYNKPVIKIQKWKKDLPKLNRLNYYYNNNNEKLINMALSLLVESNSTLKRNYYNTNSNGNINTTNNNCYNIMSPKNLKDTLNLKIKQNDNITCNIQNNLIKFSRNLNGNNSSSLTKTNDKVITSYHTKSVKNFNSILKNKKGSLTLHKSNSRRKAK